MASSKLSRLWPVIVAGEAIFLLPFVLPRLMRPTLLREWELTNTQLGMAFSVYGFVAMVSYWLGGPLADRFQPKKLMASALLATAAAGLILTAAPSATTLCLVYGCFGVTTILLFWSAMLRTTHDLADPSTQGTAFGILDAGRGLVAAVIASLLVVLIGEEATMTKAIWVAIMFVSASAVAVYWGLPSTTADRDLTPTKPHALSLLWQIAKRTDLWRQGFIVLCAYCCFKGIDTYGLFLVDAFKSDEVTSSRITTIVFWMRPIAAITAGFASDHFGKFKTMTVAFIAIAITHAAMASSPTWAGAATGTPLFVVGLLLSTAGLVYALRGVYFAVSDELNLPDHNVGTALGFVSTIGFLPDIFYGVISGMTLDRNPGVAGHQIVFSSLAFLAIAGAFASGLSERRSTRSTGKTSDLG